MITKAGTTTGRHDKRTVERGARRPVTLQARLLDAAADEDIRGLMTSLRNTDDDRWDVVYDAVWPRDLDTPEAEVIELMELTRRTTNESDGQTIIEIDAVEVDAMGGGCTTASVSLKTDDVHGRCHQTHQAIGI